MLKKKVGKVAELIYYTSMNRWQYFHNCKLCWWQFASKVFCKQTV